VSVRIEDATLMSFYPDIRELLRTRPNPLSYDQARTLRGARSASPPPRPSVEPITFQRRVPEGVLEAMEEVDGRGVFDDVDGQDGAVLRIARPPPVPLDPGTSATCGTIIRGDGRRLPPAPSSTRTWVSVDHTTPAFPSPNVKQHPGLKRQGSVGTRHAM
jgi:hypothetical protein